MPGMVSGTRFRALPTSDAVMDLYNSRLGGLLFGHLYRILGERRHTKRRRNSLSRSSGPGTGIMYPVDGSLTRNLRWNGRFSMPQTSDIACT